MFVILQLLESQIADVGQRVKQKFMHELFTLMLTVWQSSGEGKKGGSNIDWSAVGKLLVSYREKSDLTAEAKISFNKLARVLNLTW